MVGDLQAQYCVKMTGVFEGKMGTKRWKKYSAVQLSILENTFTFHCQKGKRLKIAKSNRFCSSRDWGRYCEYIKRPGDIQVDFHADNRWCWWSIIVMQPLYSWIDMVVVLLMLIISQHIFLWPLSIAASSSDLVVKPEAVGKPAVCAGAPFYLHCIVKLCTMRCSNTAMCTITWRCSAVYLRCI